MTSRVPVPRKAAPPNSHSWQRFLVQVCRLLAARLQAMPRARAMRFGALLGRTAYRASPSHRRSAEQNLRLTEILGKSATSGEREALVRQVFIHFGKVVVDFLIGASLTSDALERLVTADGFEHIQTARRRGKGIILITAHLGNWELLGRWIAAHGVPLTVVARDPDDPVFSAYVRGLREQAGVGVARKGGAVRELLGLLKRNQALGLLPDQNSGDLFVPFFGLPTGTVAGPAALALHSDAALIPTYCVRLPDDRYRLIVLPPIDTTPTADRDADKIRIMSAVSNALEAVIREYPDQWLWLHNRWKSAFEEKNRERAWPGEEGSRAFAAAFRHWAAEDA